MSKRNEIGKIVASESNKLEHVKLYFIISNLFILFQIQDTLIISALVECLGNSDSFENYDDDDDIGLHVMGKALFVLKPLRVRSESEQSDRLVRNFP
jgi:hypothetical protein